MTIQEIQDIKGQIRSSPTDVQPKPLDLLYVLWEIALQLAVQNRQIAVYTDMMEEAKKRGDSAIKEMIAGLMQELEKMRIGGEDTRNLRHVKRLRRNRHHYVTECCPHCGMPNPRSAGILTPRAKELVEKGVCPNCQQSLDAVAVTPMPRDANGNPIDLDD